MIPTSALRAARAGFGLPRGSVRVLSARFGKVCLAHHVSGGLRTQVRLVPEQPDTLSRLDSETAWLSHLTSVHRLRVPRPLRWHGGALVSPALHDADGGRWRAIAGTWIPGAHLDRGLHARECREVGALLAAMHNANADAPGDLVAVRPTWGVARLFELATTLRDLITGSAEPPPGLSDAQVTALRRSHDDITAAWSALPVDAQHVGLIHTDAHCRNLRWEGRRPGLVDFEDFANGRYLLDVACFHHDMAARPGADARLRALLDGYDRVRSLPADWQRDLQVMLAFRRFDLAGWILSWPRVNLRAWGPDLLSSTPAYIDRTLSQVAESRHR